MMKTRTILVSIIAAISLVFFSLMSISTYINHSILGNISQSSNHHNPVTFLTVMNINIEEEKSFLATIDTWAVENNVTILRNEVDQRTNNKKLYVAGNEDYYSNLLINSNLSVHELRNITLRTYSSDNTLVKGLEQDFSILPMISHNSEIMVNNVYLINTDISNTYTLQNLLEAAFPLNTFSFFVQESNRYHTTNVFADYEAISIFLCINLLLFVFVNNHLLANSRKIAVMKSEGHSTTLIWYRYSMTYFLVLGVLSMLLGFLFSQYFINLNTNNSIIYFSILFEYTFLFILIALIFSTITLVLLKLINPINSIKGYSSLGNYLKYLSFTKFLVLVVLLFYLVPNINYLSQNAQALMQEKDKKESFQSVFVIDAIFAKYGDYHGREVFGNEKHLVSELQTNNQLFSFYQYVDYEQMANIYLVDKQYLINQKLWHPDYGGKSIVFMNDSNAHINLSYDEIVYFDVSRLENLDERLTNINGLYLSNHTIMESSILYFDNEETITPLNHSFYFEGSLMEAQNYIDALMLKHGFEPCYLVNSYSEIYSQNKQSFILDGVLDLVIGVSLLLVYIHLSFTYYRSFMSANNQIISSMWSEGYSKFRIFKSAISTNLGLILFLFTIILILIKTNRMHILGSLFVLFVLEFYILFKFVKTLQYSEIRRFS